MITKQRIVSFFSITIITITLSANTPVKQLKTDPQKTYYTIKLDTIDILLLGGSIIGTIGIIRSEQNSTLFWSCLAATLTNYLVFSYRMYKNTNNGFNSFDHTLNRGILHV